jgi:NSS family neurotransmitter:Na+ symporter
MARQSSQDEFAMQGQAYRLWRALIRYVAPLAVILVFLNAIGMI